MINLTENAIKAIKEISAAEGLEHRSIKLRVIGGGCAGFTYDMYFSDKPAELDEVFSFEDDIKIIVDPLSLQYVENVTIDFIDSDFGRGFKFLNPDTKGSCGCGSSFSI